jgi:superfamily I DNA/RNA helicase
MKSTWFRKLDELDDAQRRFILLPKHGRHQLEGPPGSGKTNLLLLRAEFIAGTGETNVLIITYTNALADFIRSGVSSRGLISPTQIQTFHSWAFQHVREFTGASPFTKGQEFDDDARAKLLQELGRANKKAPSQNLFSAIFVDEAQDLSVEELENILCLSDNVCICGDPRQGIYNRDGLTIAEKLGLQKHTLKNHYRIGQSIARVADRLIPPETGCPSLEDTCNYNVGLHGNSTAKMHVCKDRNEQFERMLELVRVQLDAFRGDSIGVFCALKEDLADLRSRFDETDLSGLVLVHGVDQGASFTLDHPIHVMTIHSAKGTEFRAVHLYGCEGLRAFPMNRRHLGFTAITRARTALNAFRSGETNRPLDNAFAKPSHMDLEKLFPSES